MMDFGDWLGWSWNGGVIRFVCSSWAEKKYILRLKGSCMGLFNDLFICIVILGVLCYYMLNGALYVIWS